MNLALEERGQKQVEASNKVNHQHPKTTPTKKQQATTIPQTPSNDRDAPRTQVILCNQMMFLFSIFNTCF